MADDILPIKVNINGRSYPLRVKRQQEETIRKAVVMINERLMQYRQSYANNTFDDFDYLVMVTIDYVQKYLTLESTTDDTQLLSQLKELTSDMDNYIKKSQVL